MSRVVMALMTAAHCQHKPLSDFSTSLAFRGNKDKK
jgi:hypothetical protein